MNTIFRSVFVLLVFSLVIPFRGLSQDLSFEFADKPRLIECGGKPCFRLDLIAVDEEQRTVALGMGDIEDVSNFTVEEIPGNISLSSSISPKHQMCPGCLVIRYCSSI